MNGKPSHTVFLSHSTEDLPFVTQLRKKLEDGGWHVLVDSDKIRAGDSLPAAIKTMIDDAQHVDQLAAINVGNEMSLKVRTAILRQRRI